MSDEYDEKEVDCRLFFMLATEKLCQMGSWGRTRCRLVQSPQVATHLLATCFQAIEHCFESCQNHFKMKKSLLSLEGFSF